MLGGIMMIMATQDFTAPSVPTNLTATNITATTFTLNWTASTDEGSGVWKYTIYRNGSGHMEVYTNTASITGVPTGTTNTWTIRVEDVDKNMSSASNGLVVTQLDTQAPTEPTSLVASNITDTSFRLSWDASTDNVGVVSYNLWKDGALAHLTSTVLYKDITGLSAGSAANWAVSAKDAAGNESTHSNGIQVQQTGSL